jgi:hypothetical protein
MNPSLRTDDLLIVRRVFVLPLELFSLIAAVSTGILKSVSLERVAFSSTDVTPLGHVAVTSVSIALRSESTTVEVVRAKPLSVFSILAEREPLLRRWVAKNLGSETERLVLVSTSPIRR